jgi:hypothetical protein
MHIGLRSGLGALTVFAATLALGGCGGIEFQGKLFDYAGLTGKGEQHDVKMAERAPLVLPPDTNSLPPPSAPAYTAHEDWPVDADKRRKDIAAAQEAEQQKNKEPEGSPTSPYAGKPTLLTKAFGKLMNKPDEEEIADVPEPDPSDKTPEDKAREAKALAANGGVAKPLNPGIIEAPKPEEDPFHPSAPDTYKQMSGQAGN